MKTKVRLKTNIIRNGLVIAKEGDLAVVESYDNGQGYNGAVITSGSEIFYVSLEHIEFVEYFNPIVF